jgi:hypothetical protein
MIRKIGIEISLYRKILMMCLYRKSSYKLHLSNEEIKYFHKMKEENEGFLPVVEKTCRRFKSIVSGIGTNRH